MKKFSQWLSENKFWLCESVSAEEFLLQDADVDEMYKIFKNSYEESTGHSWDLNTFLGRASDWTFYGIKPTEKNDPKAGFVAVRKQKSGIIKLTGVGGNPFSINRGLDLLIATGKPIWGGVSEKIAEALTKKGFIIPPKSLVTQVAPYIPGFNVNALGNVVANITGGVGEVEKTIVINNAYLDWLETEHPNLSTAIKAARAGMAIVNWFTGEKS